jgi:hypothetical protein
MLVEKRVKITDPEQCSLVPMFTTIFICAQVMQKVP